LGSVTNNLQIYREYYASHPELRTSRVHRDVA